MPDSLWSRLLLSFLVVALVALMSALMLRGLVIRDFSEYIEGEMEDRIYWVIADLETTYAKQQEWDTPIVQEDLIWALMLGLEVRLKDSSGAVVIDTHTAVSRLSAGIKSKMLAVAAQRAESGDSPYYSYPLFEKGRQIGELEVKVLKPRRESIFIQRADRLLLISVIVTGLIAVAFSILLAHTTTRPVRRLSEASRAIGAGDLSRRVEVSGAEELRSLGETFNKMASALQLQESLRRKLLSNVAHELRTPVAAMQTEIEGIIDGIVPLEKERVISLHEEILRLRKLIDALAQVHRAEASALSLQKEHISLAAFFDNIRERFRGQAAIRQIRIETVCPQGLVVAADPEKLSQILVNLVGNAFEAIDGPGTISLLGEDRGQAIAVTVQDTGTGIDAETLPLIFERFFSGREGGLGIGLSIVKELVEAHGGTIGVQSETGKGTVFTILFPKGLNNS